MGLDWKIGWNMQVSRPSSSIVGVFRVVVEMGINSVIIRLSPQGVVHMKSTRGIPLAAISKCSYLDYLLPAISIDTCYYGAFTCQVRRTTEEAPRREDQYTMPERKEFG